MALPKTSITFRMDSATLLRVRALAEKDNRTVNNLVETILMWAVAKPDILKLMKNARKPMTLGAIMGEVDEMRKTLMDVPQKTCPPKPIPSLRGSAKQSVITDGFGLPRHDGKEN